MNFRTVLNFLSETSLVNLDKNTKRLDIEYMICSVFNLERFDLYVNPPRITIREEELLLSMISRRNKGEPLAYILGSKHFWNLELTLNKHVMVPRPETETLIFAVLNQFGEEPVVVLDAGTGSGALALALANERKKWQIFASDISEDALQIAKQNNQKLKLPVNFIKSDWLVPFGNESLDLIVSNPPYIKENDLSLESDGVKYEPLSSLVSKEDGLKNLKEIISSSYACLKSYGQLFVEHAPWQSIQVKKFFLESNFDHLRVFKDLNGDERISAAVKS